VPEDDDVILDFDAEDRLVGIEVLSASKRLPLPLLGLANSEAGTFAEGRRRATACGGPLMLWSRR
jgi:uncharacterized protein YuzE